MTTPPPASRHRRVGTAAALAALLGTALTACAPPPSTSGIRTVNPCDTQAAITCDAVTPHLVSPPTGVPRGQLAVVLNGSGATPSGYQKLVGELATAGFHVVAVRYPSSVGTTGACPQANAGADPDCHRRFRGELTFGAGVADPNGLAMDHDALVVNGSNSVVNRTLQLVELLASSFPGEDWRQYQQQSGGVCTTVDPTYGACDLDWSTVVLVGHSLGAGEGLYLSKFHAVARVAMISGPFDEYIDGSAITVAPWITEGAFATPAGAMFGITHATEPNAAGQSAAWDALGMVTPAVSVDGNAAPYGGAQQLTTSLSPACTLDTNGKHNSTAQDACTPGSPPTLAAAWRTLAGA